MPRSWAWISRHARQHGVAHEDRRSTRRGLLVVGHDGRVAHHDGDPVERRPQLVARDLREDGARALAHVRGARVDDDAAVGQESDGGVREPRRGTRLDAHGDAAASPGRRRRMPADELRCPTHRLLPVAVGRRVPGDEGLALAGQVLETDRQAIDAELPRPLVEVGLDGPVHLRVAEAAEGRGGHGVREHAPGHDPRGRHAIRSGADVAALAHDTVGDVHVGADEVVGRDVLEGDGAIRPQARPHADLRGCPSHGLEGLLERQHQSHRAAGSQGHEGHQWLVLGMLLATEATPRVGSQHAHLRERHAQDPGQDALQPVGVLDGRPDRDAVAIGGGHEGVRLDGEVGDHRERVGVVHDEVGRRGLDVAPADPVHLEDVALRQRIVRAQRRVLDEGRAGVQGSRQRHDGRQLLVRDAHQVGGRLGRIAAVGSHGRHGVPVVLRLPDGEDGPVLDLRAEARHGLRQVGRRHAPGGRRGPARASLASMATILARATRYRHQLGVQLVGQVDVGHVLLVDR